MARVLRGILVVLAAAAVGGLIEWGPAEGLTNIAQAKPKGPKGGEKGPKGGKGKADLEKTYEALTDVTAWTGEGRDRLPRDLRPLFDQAKDLYRDAVRAAREDEGRRVDELAKAAHDAARGLVHALRADAPAIRGLPAPPSREDRELDDLLQRTRDRLEDVAEDSRRGPGRAFSDAARRLYDRARRESRDDSARALQLARAAEAWTHVGEHLARADEREDARREPERRRERPRPPEERRRPAPPPPPRD